MVDFSDHHQSDWTSGLTPRRKRLGGYLVEAGLLTSSQVDVALNDQKLTGMRFGEILAARGWVKQQTIEYFMEKVILPEQEAIIRAQSQEQQKLRESSLPYNRSTQNTIWESEAPASSVQVRSPVRREIPITKPLPSVGGSDEDVSWVG
jgi:hypothetical protein